MKDFVEGCHEVTVNDILGGFVHHEVDNLSVVTAGVRTPKVAGSTAGAASVVTVRDRSSSKVVLQTF